MTRDQIIAKWNGLTPRERDAWVEEVIFGDTGVINVGEYWFCGGNLRFPLPFYTEDISAAWTVFECHPYVEVARIPREVPIYGVRVNDDDGMVRAMTQSQTAPEAISLAAIIAKLSPAV